MNISGRTFYHILIPKFDHKSTQGVIKKQLGKTGCFSDGHHPKENH